MSFINFFISLKNHQIKPVQGFSLFGKLISYEHGAYPPRVNLPKWGVLCILEQGTNLGIISAVFHSLNEDGGLGAPCVVKHPIFEIGNKP